MSICCCNCFFYYYLLKINRNPNFLKNINSLNPNDWPKVLKKKLKVLTGYPEYQDEWPKAASSCGSYSQVPGLLFHACRSCIENILEITGTANDLSLQEVFSKSCHFVNLWWLSTEKNCPDKFHYKVGSLTNICEECELKLCLKFIQRDFNYLDKSYIITKNDYNNFVGTSLGFI